MRIDVDKREFLAIIDALKGNLLKCEHKTAAELVRRLEWQLNGKGPDDPRRTFVPMRSFMRGYNLDGLGRSPKKAHWSFHKPRPAKQGTKAKQPKPALSAKDILDQI